MYIPQQLIDPFLFLNCFISQWHFVFISECTGLPWLGNFSHLAPVTDFAGSQLYDDKNETSPFPVRTPDHLSYKIGTCLHFFLLFLWLIFLSICIVQWLIRFV